MEEKQLCREIADTIRNGVGSPNGLAWFSSNSADELESLLLKLVDQIKLDIRKGK